MDTIYYREEPPVEAISSNHFSHDLQVADAMSYLQREHPEDYADMLALFPEYDAYIMSGAHFDTEAMGVDPEWSSWIADAIEDTGKVFWEEGEPWVGRRTRTLHVTATFDAPGAWECWSLRVHTDLTEEEITPEWLTANPEAWEFYDLKDRGYADLVMTAVEEVEAE